MRSGLPPRAGFVSKPNKPKCNVRRVTERKNFVHSRIGFRATDAMSINATQPETWSSANVIYQNNFASARTPLPQHCRSSWANAESKGLPSTAIGSQTFDLTWPLALGALIVETDESAFVPSGGAKLHAGSHQRPLFQTLSILANDMLPMTTARMTGGAKWLDTSKGIGGNCVLL